MKKPKIFIACDTTSLSKARDIISKSKTNIKLVINLD